MEDEDQSLSSHTRKGKNKKEISLPKKFKIGQRDNSKIICYCCQNWDTLLGISPSLWKLIIRKEVRGIKLTQMKMMSLPRRLQRKMNEVMLIMFLS
jgi:hypothetical protein